MICELCGDQVKPLIALLEYGLGDLEWERGLCYTCEDQTYRMGNQIWVALWMIGSLQGEVIRNDFLKHFLKYPESYPVGRFGTAEEYVEAIWEYCTRTPFINRPTATAYLAFSPERVIDIAEREALKLPPDAPEVTYGLCLFMERLEWVLRFSHGVSAEESHLMTGPRLIRERIMGRINEVNVPRWERIKELEALGVDVEALKYHNKEYVEAQRKDGESIREMGGF